MREVERWRGGWGEEVRWMGERRRGDGLPGSQASTIFLLLYDGLLWRTLLVLHLRMESADMLLFHRR